MIPYRIDLAGGWLDQPHISKLHPGWVITLSLEPIQEYVERCGMATSTRKSIMNLWDNLPNIEPKKLAELVFRYDNQPGCEYVSGAQDAIGICVPGLSRHYYDGEYWPTAIEVIYDDAIFYWLEDIIKLSLKHPRPRELNMLSMSYLSKTNASKLAEASELCWEGLMTMNTELLANAMCLSHEAQRALYPLTGELRPDKGQCKYAGAGGGGYIIMVSDKDIEGTNKIKIRRK